MTDKRLAYGQPIIHKKYTPAFKAACIRQVAAGAWQSDVACTQGISLAILGCWQRAALALAVPSSAEREEIKRLRAELKRVEVERDILKKLRLPPPTILVKGIYSRV
jgi:transposase